MVKLPFSVISTFDYYSNKTVYYSTFGGPIASISTEYPKLMPFNDEWSVSALVVDMVCKNIYVYDQTAHKMYVIDMQNKNSGIIFSDLPGVKDIAITYLQPRIFMLTSSTVRNLFTILIKYCT